MLHDSHSKAIGVFQVDRKGVSPRVLGRLVEYLGVLGYSRVVLKSDQEPSIVALKAVLRDSWVNGDCTLEKFPAYDPEANGGVERAVRSVKEMVRTLKSDLESKSQIELKLSSPGDRNLLKLLFMSGLSMSLVF